MGAIASNLNVPKIIVNALLKVVFFSMKVENVMSSVSVLDAKIREKFRRDIGPPSKLKMVKNVVIARSQTVSKNIANASIEGSSATLIVNAKGAKIKMMQ